VIFLRGLFINMTKLEGKNLFGFTLSSENKNLKVKSLYHKSETVINEWILCLKKEANNLNFEDKYQKGRKLGNGKFSTVWQC
jgi:hypothetical protein